MELLQSEPLVRKLSFEVAALVVQEIARGRGLGDEMGGYIVTVDLELQTQPTEVRRIELQFHLAIARAQGREELASDPACRFLWNHRDKRRERGRHDITAVLHERWRRTEQVVRWERERGGRTEWIVAAHFEAGLCGAGRKPEERRG